MGGEYCLADGIDLTWIRDGSFDFVISYWALYHILSMEQQCDTLWQLLCKLRPGGKAFLGGHCPSLHILHTCLNQTSMEKCLQGRRGCDPDLSDDFHGLL